MNGRTIISDHNAEFDLYEQVIEHLTTLEITEVNCFNDIRSSVSPKTEYIGCIRGLCKFTQSIDDDIFSLNEGEWRYSGKGI